MSAKNPEVESQIISSLISYIITVNYETPVVQILYFRRDYIGFYVQGIQGLKMHVGLW